MSDVPATSRYRLVRTLLRQDRSGPWILHVYACILVKRRSCGTELTAFERSKNRYNINCQAFVFPH